jgi:hypothetical protein
MATELERRREEKSVGPNRGNEQRPKMPKSLKVEKFQKWVDFFRPIKLSMLETNRPIS